MLTQKGKYAIKALVYLAEKGGQVRNNNLFALQFQAAF